MTRTIRPQVKGFRGLDNVSDPQRLSLGWLTQADNIDISDKYALMRARGFAQTTTNYAITGAYATDDMQQLFVVDAGELRRMNADLSDYEVLRTGLSAQKMFFAEVNGVVFYSNGVDFGTIDNYGAHDWGVVPPAPPTVVFGSGTLPAATYQVLCTKVNAQGIESGNSDVVVVNAPANSAIVITPPSGCNVYVTAADGNVFFLLAENVTAPATYTGSPDLLGRELTYWNIDPPRGSIVALYDGRMCLAETFAASNVSAVWCSLPLQFHHFDYGADAFLVPGTVRMLRATVGALIVGTDAKVYAWDGEKLTELANYGVAPGWHASRLKDQLYFWSLRGLCRALPFTNLTESSVSVPPGLSAGATVIERDGIRRYVVALHKGGEAFNRRTA